MNQLRAARTFIDTRLWLPVKVVCLSLLISLAMGTMGYALLMTQMPKAGQSTVAEPVLRTISLKLPLKQTEFHWTFMSKKELLAGKLVVRITRGGQSNEIVIFQDGQMQEGWGAINLPSNPKAGEIYFGFKSTRKYATAPNDQIEIELFAKQDLNGIGPLQTGTLTAGVYKAQGTYSGLIDEYKVPDYLKDVPKETIDKIRQQMDFTAFLENWQQQWDLRITSDQGWLSATQQNVRLGMQGPSPGLMSFSAAKQDWFKPPAVAPAKQPFYIECRPDQVVLYPGESTATWEELQRPDNAVAKLFDNVQEHAKDQYIVIIARPQSVKFFRMIRKIVSQRPIEIGYDVLETGKTLKWNEPEQRLVMDGTPAAPGAPLNVKPRPRVTDKRPVFFECRNEQVFWIDKDGIDAQVAKILATVDPESDRKNWAAKVLNGGEIGTEYYRVVPSYLLALVVALEPRAGVKGDTDKTMDAADSKFQRSLHNLAPKTQYPVFLIRDDSFNVFRKARQAAEALGLETGWELLGKDEPIKFGTGGCTSIGSQ